MMNRRHFIKTAAALAALATVPGQVLCRTEKTALDRMLELKHVHDRKFFLIEPVEIMLPGTVIERCQFHCMAPMQTMIFVGENSPMFRDCEFFNHGLAECCIQFNEKAVGMIIRCQLNS